MRTVLIILGGFVLWGVCLAIGKLIGGGSPTVSLWATVGFIAAWFIVAAVNMWAGVTKAGYTFQEELPIFFIIFLLPAAIAAFVRWKWP